MFYEYDQKDIKQLIYKYNNSVARINSITIYQCKYGGICVCEDPKNVLTNHIIVVGG